MKMRSGPFEAREDRVVVCNLSAIVKNELIIKSIVVGNVDNFGPSELTLQFGHEFNLIQGRSTCFPLVWHSKKSPCSFWQLVAG